ncbi:hypothetical protein WJ03_28870 [Burkholderia vietnamiensis]|nr:hypothetical protein WJ03_28870 [Burkholderia vietnamiensis]
MPDARCAIRDTRYAMRDTRCAMRRCADAPMRDASMRRCTYVPRAMLTQRWPEIFAGRRIPIPARDAIAARPSPAAVIPANG